MNDTQDIIVIDNEEYIIVIDNEEDIIVIDNEEDIIVIDNEDDIIVIDNVDDIIVIDNEEDITVIDNEEDITVIDNQEDIIVIDNEEDIIVIDNEEDITIIDNEDKERVHCVYLLRSLDPKHLRRTYIGYTVDPSRRIRQHNGEISGGAKRTSKARPWKMVCYIEGFPDQRTALQYEWINNHPKTKRWGVNGRITTMRETLMKEKFTKTSKPTKDLSLVINWLESGHSIDFGKNSKILQRSLISMS